MVSLLEIAQRPGLAVPAQVERDQPNARGWSIEAERLTEVAAQAVLEHERQAVAFVAVVELQAVAIEGQASGSAPIQRVESQESAQVNDDPSSRPRLSSKP